jgi:hypothetical protein
MGRDVHRMLVTEYEMKREPEIPTRERISEWTLKKKGWESVEWTHLAQDRSSCDKVIDQ